MTAGCYPVLNYIPVAALTGIMIVVVLHTFKWFSLRMLLACILPESTRKNWNWHYKIDLFEILTIVVVTVTTIITNLVYAVFIGTAMAGLIAAWNIGKKVNVTSDVVKAADGTCTKGMCWKVHSSLGPRDNS